MKLKVIDTLLFELKNLELIEYFAPDANTESVNAYKYVFKGCLRFARQYAMDNCFGQWAAPPR